jgi:hypothetical protein
MRAGNKKDADDGGGRGQEAPGPMKKKTTYLGPIKESTWLDSKYLQNNL